MNRFDKERKKFDRDFERMSKLVTAGWIITLLVALATLAGIAFVVYKLLAHFGIL